MKPKHEVLQDTEAVVGYGGGAAYPGTFPFLVTVTPLPLGEPLSQVRNSLCETGLAMLMGWQVSWAWFAHSDL